MSRTFAIMTVLTLTFGSAASQPVDRCFTASINDSVRQDLWLHANGRYASVNRDGTAISWVDSGTWRRLADADYILVSDTDVKSVESGRLGVGIGPKHLVSLLPDLADAIHAFLSESNSSEYPDQQIRAIAVTGESCPPEHAYICAGGCYGPWFYHLNVRPGVTWPVVPVTRAELEDLLRAIDAYLSDQEKNAFRVTLVQEGGYTAVAWRDGAIGWASQRTDLDGLKARLSSLRSAGGFGGDSELMLTDCSLLPLPPSR
jgi:hypothetical protein